MIRSNRAAYFRRHLCELLLLLLLAAPILALDFTTSTVGFVGFCLVALLVLGYRTDMASRLQVDEDGITFLDGGADARFLAWPEIGEIVPRRFKGWPAEDALVALSPDGRPMLVAGVSMFRRSQVLAALDFAQRFVNVADVVALSPVTARAHGRKRPELAPQRASERLLASAIGGAAMTLVIAAAIIVLKET